MLVGSVSEQRFLNLFLLLEVFCQGRNLDASVGRGKMNKMTTCEKQGEGNQNVHPAINLWQVPILLHLLGETSPGASAAM